MKNRIEREKQTVGLMIRLYCRRAENNRELCPACRNLLDYACLRLDYCPHDDKKPACKKCRMHCYKPQYREEMRKVMRFAGWRMLFCHPVAAVKHLWHS
jgi:hypothetical protein